MAGKNLPYVMILYVMTSYNVKPCTRFVARTRVYGSCARVHARIFTRKKFGGQVLSYELNPGGEGGIPSKRISRRPDDNEIFLDSLSQIVPHNM